jgi:hypothetical protein
MENDVREAKRPQHIDLSTNPNDPYFLNQNSFCHHKDVQMFGFEKNKLLD